jgi:hypothetical protein
MFIDARVTPANELPATALRPKGRRPSKRLSGIAGHRELALLPSNPLGDLRATVVARALCGHGHQNGRASRNLCKRLRSLR